MTSSHAQERTRDWRHHKSVNQTSAPSPVAANQESKQQPLPRPKQYVCTLLGLSSTTSREAGRPTPHPIDLLTTNSRTRSRFMSLLHCTLTIYMHNFHPPPTPHNLSTLTLFNRSEVDCYLIAGKTIINLFQTLDLKKLLASGQWWCWIEILELYKL